MRKKFVVTAAVIVLAAVAAGGWRYYTTLPYSLNGVNITSPKTGVVQGWQMLTLTDQQPLKRVEVVLENTTDEAKTVVFRCRWSAIGKNFYNQYLDKVFELAPGERKTVTVSMCAHEYMSHLDVIVTPYFSVDKKK